MSYNEAHGKKQNWLSVHSDQSIIDARRISRTVTVLEHPLTVSSNLNEYSFLFWLVSFIYERKGRSNLPQDERSEYEMNDNTEPLEEDVQTEDVLDETFVVWDIQTVLVSIV